MLPEIVAVPGSNTPFRILLPEFEGKPGSNAEICD